MDLRHIETMFDMLAEALKEHGHNKCSDEVLVIRNEFNGERADKPYPATDKEKDLYVTKGKIHAIKAYRERTGQGLKASKDAIDIYCSHLQCWRRP